MNKDAASMEIVKEAISSNAKSIDDVRRIRVSVCKKLKSKTYPSFISILESATEEERKKLWFLVFKPTRTIAGVAPLAIMTKPFACPHGKCTFCPGGINSIFGNVPQSYTGNEPASMRAKRNDYDPYLQVFNRLEQYALLNQSSDKVELILMSGTFPSLSYHYQEEFVKYALKAMNDFSGMFFSEGKLDFAKFKEFFELPSEVKNDERTKRIKEKLMKLKGECDLESEQKRNETSKTRCVAMAIETKPDYAKEEQINNMLKLGCTRVELGVQCLNDNVLKHINRGHSLQDTIKATRLIRNSLLKICFHVMPGLPGMTKEMDFKDYKELFTNPDYMPDAIKIYPAIILKGTGLYEMWKIGKYRPLSTEDAVDIIIEAKKRVPKWCRIMRIQRDIPSTIIDAGPNMTNMRQLAEKKLRDKGIKCKCIRCREPHGRQIDWSAVKLVREDYEASGGKEIFLSFEDTRNDFLLGFCRLRIVPESHRQEVSKNSAGIRELHVYGQATPIGKKGNIQHLGLGSKLLAKAEEIAYEEFYCKKILVISGIGVREYYKNKFGYKNDGPYLSKILDGKLYKK